MTQLRGVRVPLVMLCLSVSLFGQPWAGILDPSRAINWTLAGAGAIPNRTTICSTLNPGATAAQINSSIASCPAGQVVYLSAGTYNLSTGLIFANKSNVTLRGAGANQTNLIFAAANSCGGVGAEICMFNGDAIYSGQPENTANWTGSYAQGATQITLDNTANLKVGTLVILDQLEDTADTGNIYVGQQTWSCVNCNNPGRLNRGQTQTVLVTAISGNTVSITPPLYMPNWRSGQTPGAWWSGVLPVTGDGVENLSVDSTTVSTGAIIAFYEATGCWAKGVRTIEAFDSHVKFWFGDAFNTVRDSYFYGSQGHGATSSQSYGVDGYTGSANLVENNIFQHIATPLQMEDQQGTVFGYNYSFDNFNGPDINWLLGTSSHHAPGNEYLLWEGNQGVFNILDDFHGPADFITFFRTYTTGWQPAATNETMAVSNTAWSRYTNAIGNVFGTAGYHTNYSSVQGDGSNGSVCNHSIYALGWGGNCGVWAPYPNCGMNGCPQSDALVATTLMRWGNYDTVTNGNRFVAAEVPSGLPIYANAVPSTQNLPASFYMSGQPSWFGGSPWPSSGPDVIGGNIPSVGGHANSVPAANCFNSSAVDTNYATAYTGVTATWAAGIATVTIGTSEPNPASTITITGMTPAAYNCQHCVLTATTSTTVSYAVASNPGGSGSGGTAYWPDIISFNASACYGNSGGTTLSAPTGLRVTVF
jgi:hypothetical protein